MYRRITNIQMDVTMILRLKEVTKRILEREKQPKKTAKKTTKKTKTTTPKKK
jgi:hypothetical protein